jgi:TolB-like protein
MTEHQNRFSRFWQELKRRRVVHVVTVYASAAFVIIELVNNLTEPLNLPAALSTIVIILLAVGFPLAIVLSWLYDLTAGTIVRTKPAEDLPETETVRVPNAWKIATYLSFVVIAGLIVLNIAGRSDLIKPGMIQAVAVLPFSNYTGDDRLDYVADGMHASLISDIGKVSALRVTSETTSKTYKNTDKSAPQIGEELDVGVLIEPALTCWGEEVCVLIKAITTNKQEKQILVREYKLDREEILSFYSRVTKEFAQEIQIELSPEEMRLLSKTRKVDQEAYDEYLKARSFVNDFRKESLLQAIDHLNSAIKKEPDWAPLYAGLAERWFWMGLANYESPAVTGPKVTENLNRAMELDPDLSEVHSLSALIAWWWELNWEKSEKVFFKALALDPGDSWTRLLYAQLLLILQRNDEAEAQIELAVSIDPFNDGTKLLYSGTLVQAGDFEAALTVAEELAAINPASMNANNMIESAAYHLGQYDKVISAVQYTLPFSLEEDVYEGIVRMYNESGIAAAYSELLKHMEDFALNNPMGFLEMSSRYIIANQPEKAMEWIEKGFELRDWQIGFIVASGGHYEPLYNNPRFIAICEKANLPLPTTH